MLCGAHGCDGRDGAADRPGSPTPGRAQIRRGIDALGRCDALGRPYALQAAVTERHALAPSVEATDWDRIVVRYEALGRIAPSPVVELNRAVAVAMATGPPTALAAG